jgi:phage tail-like protein
MAIPRPDRPYVQFNFWVTIQGLSAADQPQAGFQECSNLGTEVTVAEYRNGNDKFNNVRKIIGMNKATDVTLKRGAIGNLELYDWLNKLRNGEQDERTVTIELKSEDRTQTVQKWTLNRAKIIKSSFGPFNAKGTDVLMEELTIAYEQLIVE